MNLLRPYYLLWSHRELLARVIETTLRQRYSGSVVGIGWLFIGPFILISAYAFMFVVVLQISSPTLSSNEYIAHLATGLVIYLTISQCLMAATGALTQDPSLLFNKVFPAELFPVREVLVGMPLLGAGILGAISWGVISGTFGWAWLWLPIILLLLVSTLIGCGWVLSLANLVTQDVAQILGFVLILIMLTSPIAFEPAMLPAQARFLVDANPVAYFIGSVQLIVVRGIAPDPGWIIGMALTAFMSFHAGYTLFMKGKGIIIESI